MKRKKYSNDNRLTVQLSDKQYKKVLDLSTKIHCSKVDVIRYLLTGSRVSQADLNRAMQYDEKLTTILDKLYNNLYRIGGNLHQTVHNQDILIKYGNYKYLEDDYTIDKLKDIISGVEDMVLDDLTKPRKIWEMKRYACNRNNFNQ